ncbi:MAG: hypothetical protein FIB01_01310, partial [Gemmatimonadetes bacterium]|nr:hypothetical protein [Gemmatimonadota bacterium]
MVAITRKQRRAVRATTIVVAALFLLLLFSGGAARLYTDALWFGELGLGAVYGRRLLATVTVRLVAGALVAALVFGNLLLVARRLGPVHVRRRYGNLEIAEQVPRATVVGLALLLSLLAGWWLSGVQFGGATPLSVWAWFRHVPWQLSDPLFGRDLSFYVFVLPLAFRLLDLLLLATVWAAFLAMAGYGLVGSIRLLQGRMQLDDAPRLHIAALAATVLALVAIRLWLGRYALLLDGNGFRGSIGYTDVHARLPALGIGAVLAVAAAVALVYGARRRLWAPPALAIGLFLLAGVVGRGIYPALVQKLQVEPNQLAREEPYIRWNLDYTRRAYGVDRLTRDTLPHRLADARDWSSNASLLGTLPLWDPEPLQRVFTELQAPQAYYTFLDVDYDRYATGGEARQIAIGVREFREEEVPAASRNWHNLHLNPRFTRGFGAVVVPSDESVQGQPVFWLSGVSPIQRAASAPAAIRLTDPAVYFGEAPGGSRYVVLTPVSARGPGIRRSSFLRVLAFAWRFGDQNLLFARGITDQSRVLFRRQVLDRLRTVAPFLQWDPDPLPFLRNGRVVWLVDGYTVASAFPIARPMEVEGMGLVRYLRPSVKALVDATDGSIVIHALEARPDPILASFSRVFPGLIKPAAGVPEDVRAHFRYPALALRLQADVLEEYHLQDPESFFVGEDAWELPQDVGASATARQYRPVYLTARMPDTAATEFVALLPFIARQRQNLTGLLAARNDPPRYGQLVLLQLPRQRQVRGPGQVQSLIEQDPGISAQLSLWRQRGTDVELGRLRIVPADSTLLYVRPLFLTARDQQGAIPQLQRIIVSDGANVSMAETLESAVAGLYRAEVVGESAAA